MLACDSRILALETSGQIGSVALGTPAGVLLSEQLPVDVRHAGQLLPAVQRLLQRQGWAADSITDVFLSIGPGSFTGLRIAVSIARTLAWSIGSRIVAVPTMRALARNAMLADPVPEHIAMIVDAKRAQVYTACYRLTQRVSNKTCGTGILPVQMTGWKPVPHEVLPDTQSQSDSPAVPAKACGSCCTEESCCVELTAACLAEPRAFLADCPKPLAVLGEGIPRHREAIEAAGATILPETLWSGRAEHVLAVGLEMAAAGEFTPARELVPLYIRRPEMEERWEARQMSIRQQQSS